MTLPRNLPDRAFNFGVVLVADQHDVVAVAGVTPSFRVHLGHQRTGRVDRTQPPRRRVLLDLRRHPVSAENGYLPPWNLLDLLHESHALRLQILHDPPIVNNLMPDVHRWPELPQRCLHDIDGPLDSCAKASRLGQDDS